jgi:hypothetical protein
MPPSAKWPTLRYCPRPVIYLPIDETMNRQLLANLSKLSWSDLAPCEHFVQFYPGDDVFLDALEGFVGGGIEKGEVVALIATPEHVDALNRRLISCGINLDRARARQLYVTLDAEESLQKFMVDGMPDATLFQQFVQSLLARSGGRRVRAFGEMVALLWARGESAAMMQLEKFWHDTCQKEGLALFCAYPRSGFTPGTENSMWEVCDAHSRIIA